MLYHLWEKQNLYYIKIFLKPYNLFHVKMNNTTEYGSDEPVEVGTSHSL